MNAEANVDVERDGRCIFYEVLFLFFFGIFLAAQGAPAAIALGCFGVFFCAWLFRLIDIERAG